MSMPVKHDFGKIGEDLVTFVERGVNKERMNFLKDLLEFNGFDVIVQEVEPTEEGAEKSYNIAVNDLVFNPVIWVYDRKLRTPDGHIVNEDYWMQRNDDFRPQYWER
ncbi:MAG: hypothetical protein L3J74_05660 [Bacteroidales bacterium]|nr:hypothetical protein [Bacteroidales bacterium]